jgi:hypothetical protein
MGWQATGWAFNSPIENSGAKFVLVALAERAGNEDDDAVTWTCFPSIETIAKYTAQGYRTIQRHLDWLESEGYITRRRRVVAAGRLGGFDFTLHKHPKPVAKLASGQIGQDLLSDLAPEDVEIGQTEPVTEPSDITREANASVVCDDASPAKQAFDAYNKLAEDLISSFKTHGREPLAATAKKLNDARRRALNARLKEVGGIEGWRMALDVVRESAFLNGSTRHQFGLTLDFLLQPSSFTKLIEGFYSKDRNDVSDPHASRHQQRAENFEQGALDAYHKLRERRGIQP